MKILGRKVQLVILDHVLCLEDYEAHGSRHAAQSNAGCNYSESKSVAQMPLLDRSEKRYPLAKTHIYPRRDRSSSCQWIWNSNPLLHLFI